MSKCEECLNSRLVVSENGYHMVCCLPEDKATDCMIGKVNHFVYLNESKNNKTKILRG